MYPHGGSSSHQQLPLLGCTLSRGMKLDMSRIENTYKKKTEAYTEKLKFTEKLAGENKTWMVFH